MLGPRVPRGPGRPPRDGAGPWCQFREQRQVGPLTSCLLLRARHPRARPRPLQLSTWLSPGGLWGCGGSPLSTTWQQPPISPLPQDKGPGLRLPASPELSPNGVCSLPLPRLGPPSSFLGSSCGTLSGKLPDEVRVSLECSRCWPLPLAALITDGISKLIVPPFVQRPAAQGQDQGTV